MSTDNATVMGDFYENTVEPIAADTTNWLEIDDDAINVRKTKNGEIIDRLVYPVQDFEEFWYDWLALRIRTTRRRIYGGFGI